MSDTGADRTHLNDILRMMRTRWRWLNVMRGGWRGLCYGAIAGAGVALLAVVAPLDGPWVWVAFALIPAGLLVGAAAGAILRIDDLRVARALDQAARSDDRFASALQLAEHARTDRWRLVCDDAIRSVRDVSPKTAVPLRPPFGARWIALPVVALLLLVVVAPERRAEAVAPLAPAIDDAEWADLEREFRRELEQLPEPRTPEEEELQRQLEELASLLAKKPEQKEALAEIARLRDRIEERQRSAGERGRSPRQAASAMQRSDALRKFAAKLREGEFDAAGTELKTLADQLESGDRQPDAAEFEDIATDLERLAAQLSENEQLQAECEECAGAAGSMNRQSFADALRRMADQMQQGAESWRQSDQFRRAQDLLEQLRNQMQRKGQCSGCANGCAACQGGMPGEGQGNGAAAFVRRNDGKGGLKAGWGTADEWKGGTVDAQDEAREGSLVNPPERAGESTGFTIITPEERADSGLSYEQMFTEFVQQAEADLELDRVPLSYREFLRRYFRSIKPVEEADEDAEASGE